MARGVLVLFGLLVSVSGLEIGLRVFRPQPLFRFRFSASLGWEQEPGARFVFTKDEFRNPVTYSSAGLRDTEHSLEKPAGTIRIVAIGDSFTEGLQVPLEDTYPKRLESILNLASQGGRYEVINFGTTGYGPDQYLVRLRNQALRYDADLILVGVFINDLDDLAEYGLSRLENGALHFRVVAPPGSLEGLSQRMRFFLRGRSHLFAFLTASVVRIRHLPAVLLRREGTSAQRDGSLESPERLRPYRRTYPDIMTTQIALAEALFQEMDRLATQHGLPIVAVLFPAQEQVYEGRYRSLLARWARPGEE